MSRVGADTVVVRVPPSITTGHAVRLPVMLQSAVKDLMIHDGRNLAQSAAYSAIIALFPGLILTAALVARLPDSITLKMVLGGFFMQVLPENVLPVLTGYFVNSAGSAGATPHTMRSLILAAIISFSGAANVIATLMEGLRRAQGVPRKNWTFWEWRLRSWVLVPLSLVPLALATSIVMFGRFSSEWMAAYLPVATRPAFFAAALLVRWTVALAGVAALTALIFYLGSRRVPGDSRLESWVRTLPGAVIATVIWFLSTLLFGWYVTRLANYNQVYGSLGAGIALLFWLYIVFFSVLVGAEFNIHYSRFDGREGRLRH